MVRYFLTVEEVEEILPEIAFLVEEAILVYEELKHEYSQTLKVRTLTNGKGKEKVIAQDLSGTRQRQIQVLNEELQDIREEIEELGGRLRDIERGIVDFPARFQGEDIYYCWKLGDDQVKHWHYEDSSDKKRIIRLGR